MQENQIDIKRYEEDEIDLKELFKTLWKNKVKIVIITSVITILAIVYVYTKTPIYEAKAIIKIGEYKLSNSNSNASELTKELEVLYIDLLKNEKNRPAEIKSISLVKKQKNLFEVVANGISNEMATLELNKVIAYVQKKHQKLLNDVKELREAQVKEAQNKLSLLNNRTLPSITEKVNRYKNDVRLYEKNFKATQLSLQKIKKSNPTLAALQINEQSYLTKILMELRDSLDAYEERKNYIELVEVPELEKNINMLDSLMKPYNYKNTEIIGEIMTNEYPVKPKKKLIVIVAFITGFILSIFLVFFLEFIRGFKEEENSLS